MNNKKNNDGLYELSAEEIAVEGEFEEMRRIRRILKLHMDYYSTTYFYEKEKIVGKILDELDPDERDSEMGYLYEVLLHLNHHMENISHDRAMKTLGIIPTV